MGVHPRLIHTRFSFHIIEVFNRRAGKLPSFAQVRQRITAALHLKVERIVVCGHSQCGGIRAAYEGVPDEAVALKSWLKLVSEALLPVHQPGPEALRRTEQRSVVLQLERLMVYPMVRRAVEAGALTLHGWHYVIEAGEIHIFDARKGDFVPASQASDCGTGPYQPYVEHDGQVIAD